MTPRQRARHFLKWRQRRAAEVARGQYRGNYVVEVDTFARLIERGVRRRGAGELVLLDRAVFLPHDE